MKSMVENGESFILDSIKPNSHKNTMIQAEHKSTCMKGEQAHVWKDYGKHAMAQP